MMSDSEYNNILEYLISVTNYSKRSLLDKDENILFKMYLRIKSCMEKYPIEILDLQAMLNINKYTLENLNKMNYHQLCSIRKQLKIVKKKYSTNDTLIEENSLEYSEPVLVSPDELYISYGIDYNNYSDEKLLDMGFVIIDREQDSYLNSIRDALYERLVNFFKKMHINIGYGVMNLEQLTDFYVKHFSSRIGYKMISEIEDEIKLEKRYKNE